MKRTLVTGAAGFVGANLARRLLADGHEVHLAISPGSDSWRIDELETPCTRVDLLDREGVESLLKRVTPDWIFHLAAHGAYSWQSEMRRIVGVNMVGAANLLDAALAVDFEAIVNAGSSSEYGAKAGAASEHDTLDPNSVYAVTKAGSTMLFRYISLSRGLPITTLRLYSAYGPWEDPRRLIPSLVVCGLDGRLPPLVDSATARDFVYIDDVVDAFELAASNPPSLGSVLNIASGIQTSIGQAVEVARKVLSIDEEPSWGSHPARIWDTDTWFGDPTRALRELGWSATRDFEEGFRKTAEWARAGGWSGRLLGQAG